MKKTLGLILGLGLSLAASAYCATPALEQIVERRVSSGLLRNVVTVANPKFKIIHLKQMHRISSCSSFAKNYGNVRTLEYKNQGIREIMSLLFKPYSEERMKIGHDNQRQIMDFVLNHEFDPIYVEGHKFSLLNSERMKAKYDEVMDSYGTLSGKSKEEMAEFNCLPGLDLRFGMLKTKKVIGIDYMKSPNSARERYAVYRALYSHHRANPYRVILYGALHDFSQEVREWNKARPNKQASLVEFIPNAILDNPDIMR